MIIDVVFTNGRLRTLDPTRPTASRIGVLGGRIVGLDGDLDGVAARRTVDLDGAPVLPGFHDAHHHLSLVGARLAAVDLRGVTDLGRLRIALRRHASTLPPGAWVHGWGYDQNALGGRHPTAEDLDAVGGGRPVLIEHVSCHMVTADTHAFELAGHPGRDGVPDGARQHNERIIDDV